MPDAFPPAQPHGSLEEIFPDVFCLRGSMRMGPGVRIPRNMVVLRDAGELTLINAVRLDDAGLAELDALGRVAHVVKIGGHGLDDAFFVDRHGARLWALPGIEPGGVAVSDRLEVDGPLPVPWLRLFVFHGTVDPEAVLIADREGGVLLACDSVQHWPDLEGCSVLARGLSIAMGFRHPANIGPPWRKRMTPEGGSLRPDFERLLREPFEHIIGGHGKPMVGGGRQGLQATVQRVFG